MQKATDHGPDGAPTPPPHPLNRKVQMNVRVPPDLIEAIDTRRQDLAEHRGDKVLSRDEWVTRALRWAVSQPVGQSSRPQLARTVRTRAGRTIDARRSRV